MESSSSFGADLGDSWCNYWHHIMVEEMLVLLQQKEDFASLAAYSQQTPDQRPMCISTTRKITSMTTTSLTSKMEPALLPIGPNGILVLAATAQFAELIPWVHDIFARAANDIIIRFIDWAQREALLNSAQHHAQTATDTDCPRCYLHFLAVLHHQGLLSTSNLESLQPSLCTALSRATHTSRLNIDEVDLKDGHIEKGETEVSFLDELRGIDHHPLRECTEKQNESGSKVVNAHNTKQVEKLNLSVVAPSLALPRVDWAHGLSVYLSKRTSVYERTVRRSARDCSNPGSTGDSILHGHKVLSHLLLHPSQVDVQAAVTFLRASSIDHGARIPHSN
jgi:hypothetical protein